ncbi:MAG: hypothetical protein J6A03_04810 [Lachnospiraceae bacterium]|nr:hypothetical protein [Lachnospiraceae bacterium]
MIFNINKSNLYYSPALAVIANGIDIGHVHPLGDTLIYNATGRIDQLKKIIHCEESLIELISFLNSYRKQHGYIALCIDDYMSGIVQLKSISFWTNLGFIYSCDNPKLLYLLD